MTFDESLEHAKTYASRINLRAFCIYRKEDGDHNWFPWADPDKNAVPDFTLPAGAKCVAAYVQHNGFWLRRDEMLETKGKELGHA